MKTKRWLTAALALFSVFGLGSAGARFPPDGYVYDVTYYSDANFTTRIGNERWTCTGYLHWGETSAYRIEHTWPCQEEQ